MYTNINLEIIQDNAQYTDSDGVSYPRNYPKDEIAELHKVTEVDRPTGDFVVTGWHIDESYTKVWETRPCNQDELDNIAEQESTQYQRDREAEYPAIGDQLDAILKQYNYDRLQGKELIQEADDIISKWLSVKSKYPKPKE